MGIRPSLMLVLGIDDLQVDEHDNVIDPRADLEKLDNRWEATLNPEDLDKRTRWVMMGDGKPPELADVFHHDAEFGVPGVAGYVWDQIGSQDTLYALAACYPEFGEAGYQVMPTVSKEDDISGPNGQLRRLERRLAEGEALSRDELRKTLRQVHYKRLAHKFDQNYARGFDLDMEWRSKVAVAVMRAAGLSIGRRDLKLMLYWQWS